MSPSDYLKIQNSLSQGRQCILQVGPQQYAALRSSCQSDPAPPLSLGADGQPYKTNSTLCRRTHGQ